MTDQNPEFKTATLEAWTKAAAKSAPGGNVDALNWITPDGIAVKPLYTAADTAELKHADTLPGFEPYLRGPQATMYAVRPWTIRQYAGFSTAEESNAFYRKALAAGGQGTNKNVNAAHIRVTQSNVLRAGPTFDKLTTYPARMVSDDYGQPPSLRTAELSLTLTPNWSQDGAVCIEQTDPLPLTVLSMTLDVATGG